MAKIINTLSGPIPPDPDEPTPRSRPAHKEVIVTPGPGPKPKAQRRANNTAVKLTETAKQQDQNAYAPRKLSKGQKKASRKRTRDMYYKAVQSDSEWGTISPERAKELLPSRQKSTKNV